MGQCLHLTSEMALWVIIGEKRTQNINHLYSILWTSVLVKNNTLRPKDFKDKKEKKIE